MLYIFDEIDNLDDEFPERCVPYLSEQRRKKVFAHRFPLGRKLSASAYMLLRTALRISYGIDAPVELAYGENGKPFLRDYPHIHFNLSHCRAAVAAAVSATATGVDVQEITPVSDGLAKRVLTAKELEMFRLSQDPDRLFCGLWAVKESFLKLTGQGLAAELRKLEAEEVAGKMEFEGCGYRGCVCGFKEPFQSVKVSLSMLESGHESVCP